MRTEDVARIVHEANRAYCKTLGDTSQPPWEDAPEWQKESAKEGVISIFTNSDMTPKKSHEHWLKKKVEDGWVYGPVKDPEKKEHPCIVSYEYLPQKQKIKDRLFVGIVKDLIPFLE